MSFYVEAPASSFKPVPAGMHLARLYRFIDLGTQENKFNGEVTGYVRKVKFVWEVHGQDEEGNPLVTDKGEPMIITKDYTLSWGEKANLRKDLESWRNKPYTPEEQRRFDLKKVLNNWCMLNVTHKPKKKGDGVYANVIGVTPVPSALRYKINKEGEQISILPEPFNPVSYFMISEPDMELFESFSKFLKEEIMKSPEWQALAKKPVQQGSGFDDMEDDIPF